MKPETCHHHVPGQGKLHGQAKELAVLGNEADTAAHHFRRRTGCYLLAEEDDLATLDLAYAENRLRHFRAARTYQSGDSHDLALAHHQVDVLGTTLDGELLQAQRFLSGGLAIAGIHLRDVPPHHDVDQLIVAEVLHQSGGGMLAVPQDRNPVANLLEFPAGGGR